jgi:hypothetical protein
MKKTLLASAIILALAATPAAFGKGKPLPEEEYGNNLSFATKFVPEVPATGEGTFLGRGTCPAVATPPDGPQCNLFPGYWCQKTEAFWQATCAIAPAGSVGVTATWGANLLGDATISAGRPIRVEMVLTEAGGAPINPGYRVIKLTDELDRLATYGTDGTVQNTDFTVLDVGATLRIETCENLGCATPSGTVLPDTEFTPEINSLGNVVYGYNWGTKGKANAPAAGIYKLTFTAINTTIVSAPGAQNCAAGENCTYVIIDVKQSSGGGGGPPNRP